MAGERSQSCLMGTAVKEGVNLMKEGNEEREFQVEEQHVQSLRVGTCLECLSRNQEVMCYAGVK